MKWKKLSYLSPRKIKTLQDKKLRSFIRNQIYPYHPYYRRLFKEKNIDPYSIKTTNDLKKIPFIKKEDIAPTKENPKKHIEFVLQPSPSSIKKYYNKIKLLNLSLKNIYIKNYLKSYIEREYKPIHLHFTTGRAALSIPFLYTSYCIKNLKEAGSRMFDVFNIKNDEIVMNAFPYAPHLAFWQTFYATKQCNLLSLHSGGGKILGSEKIINAIEKMKANVLGATPGYAYHLIRKAVEENYDLSSLKEVIFGGERIPSGLRDKIAELLHTDVRILSTYAFTEGKVAWPECEPDSGYHLYPDMEFIEIVKDDEVVGENEQGEIVYTSLDWRGSTLLRYKTGDIGRIIYEKCECERTVPRIYAKIERKSEIKTFNLTKIKGTLVNLNYFFPFFMGHKEIDEWQVVIKKRNDDPFEVDELVIYIAPRKNVDEVKLKSNLAHELREEIEVSPEIIICTREELLERLGMEKELKEKRILDIRKKL